MLSLFTIIAYGDAQMTLNSMDSPNKMVSLSFDLPPLPFLEHLLAPELFSRLIFPVLVPEPAISPQGLLVAGCITLCSSRSNTFC